MSSAAYILQGETKDIDETMKGDTLVDEGENLKGAISEEEKALKSSELFSLTLKRRVVNIDNQRHLDARYSTQGYTAEHLQYEREVNSQLNPKECPITIDNVLKTSDNTEILSIENIEHRLARGEGSGEPVTASSHTSKDQPQGGSMETMLATKKVPKKLTRGTKMAKKSEQDPKIKEFLERIRRKKDDIKRKKHQGGAYEN